MIYQRHQRHQKDQRNPKKRLRLTALLLICSLLLQGTLNVAQTSALESVGLDTEVPQITSEATTQTAETTQATETTQTAVTTQAAATTQAPIVAEQIYNLYVSAQSSSTIQLSWFVQNQSASGFYVYRKGTGDAAYALIGTVEAQMTPQFQFQDTSLARGVKYTYKVLPYHVQADQSIVTDAFSSTCSYCWSFDKPVIRSAKRRNQRVTLRWSKMAGVSGYEIYRSTGKAYKKVKTIAKQSVNSAVLKKVTTQKDVSFKIRAYTKYNGEKLYSKYSAVTTVYSSSVKKIQAKIAKLKKQYPSFYYWNHMGKASFSSSTITRIPCNHSVYGLRYCNYYYCPNGVLGLQCYGFAWKMSDLIYGRDAGYTSHKSFDKAKVGDVIRYSEHSVIIIEKKKDYIRVGECNIGGTCMILWGRKVTRSELKGAVYYHRYR